MHRILLGLGHRVAGLREEADKEKVKDPKGKLYDKLLTIESNYRWMLRRESHVGRTKSRLMARLYNLKDKLAALEKEMFSNVSLCDQLHRHKITYKDHLEREFRCIEIYQNSLSLYTHSIMKYLSYLMGLCVSNVGLTREYERRLHRIAQRLHDSCSPTDMYIEMRNIWTQYFSVYAQVWEYERLYREATPASSARSTPEAVPSGESTFDSSSTDTIDSPPRVRRRRRRLFFDPKAHASDSSSEPSLDLSSTSVDEDADDEASSEAKPSATVELGLEKVALDDTGLQLDSDPRQSQ